MRKVKENGVEDVDLKSECLNHLRSIFYIDDQLILYHKKDKNQKMANITKYIW